eukprot:830067-Pyramimonas_sp.AAC.1
MELPDEGVQRAWRAARRATKALNEPMDATEQARTRLAQCQVEGRPRRRVRNSPRRADAGHRPRQGLPRSKSRVPRPPSLSNSLAYWEGGKACPSSWTTPSTSRASPSPRRSSR